MKDDVVEKIDKDYAEVFRGEIRKDVFVEEIIEAVFSAYTELKMPELEQELERFKDKKYTTIGKIKLLEEIREEMV